MPNEWPHILADFKRKRDALNEVISVIEANFSIDRAPVDEPDDPTPVPRRKYTRRKGAPVKKQKPQRKTTDRQTDRQSKARANGESRPEPP